jgi:hypothetical protein
LEELIDHVGEDRDELTALQDGEAFVVTEIE